MYAEEMNNRDIWIVQQDEKVDNVILGVFDNFDDADMLAEEAKQHFPDHVLIQRYALGFKYTDGSAKNYD
ncbi:hypothetical protein [Glutamicibacter ardleyensis]|uniref:hypothetical protein n=1 Tax=Glutamicibacter ardleyensis TaxID=225894 RepID=UPI003FD6225F